MQLMIDVGFVVSLLLLVLGLERVALRPHQRECVQAFFEELTIKFDDLSPATIASRLGTAETNRLLALVTYFWFCAIIVVTLMLSGIVTKAIGVSAPVRNMQLARAFMCGISLMLLSRWPVPQLMALFLGNTPSPKRLSIIAVVLFFGGSTILLVTILLAQWLVLGQVQITQPTTGGPWTALEYIELAFWPAYVLMWLLVAPLTLAITVFNRPHFARQVIVPFAGLLWRLVEYEKGGILRPHSWHRIRLGRTEAAVWIVTSPEHDHGKGFDIK